MYYITWLLRPCVAHFTIMHYYYYFCILIFKVKYTVHVFLIIFYDTDSTFCHLRYFRYSFGIFRAIRRGQWPPFPGFSAYQLNTIEGFVIETTGSQKTVHFRKEYNPDILFFHGHRRETLPSSLKPLMLPQMLFSPAITRKSHLRHS